MVAPRPRHTIPAKRRHEILRAPPAAARAPFDDAGIEVTIA